MKKQYVTVLNEPSSEARRLPFFWKLPPTREGMLRFRLYVRKRCLADLEFRACIREMCALDPAFFIQVFGWWHETRSEQASFGKFPVMLDPDQVDILAWWALHVGKQDVVLDKTRGIGCSYLAVSFALWLWYFKGEGIELGLLSKDDFSLDLPGRPSSLMGKLDLMWSMMPMWMQEHENKAVLRRTHSNHRFENMVNGCAIFGYTASDQKLRSARLYCLFVDEAAFLPVDVQRWLAAAHGTTPSIVYISTHNGTACMFYRLTQDSKTDLIRISTYWWSNRRCAAGLYRSKANQVELLDEAYEYDADYEFAHDRPGELRSPWVDRAFRRPGANPQALYEELYGLAAARGRKLYDERVIEALRASARPALVRGGLDEHGFYEDDIDGDLYLWQYPDRLTGKYYLGVDPALGTKGGAYAGVVVWDGKTGTMVAGARLENCPPIQLAEFCTRLAQFLVGSRSPGYATIAWEATGIGVSFGNELKRLRWPILACEGGKENPGFHNRDRGEAWLVELGRALRDGDIQTHDARLLDDLSDFEYDANFELQFSGALGHGDLAIAAGVAWEAAKSYRRGLLRTKDKPYNTRKTGVEAEPRLQDLNRVADTWSTQWQ